MAKRGRKPGQLGKCSVCGKLGHNKATCPSKPVKGENSRETFADRCKTAVTPAPAKKVKVSKTSVSLGPKPVKLPEVKKNQPVAAPVEKPATQEKKTPVVFDLDYVINAMLQEEPYFSALSRRINKTPSQALPTAGVCIDRDTMRYQLLYNPEFMAGLTRDHRVGVLLHEYFHLTLGHCDSRRDRLALNPVNPQAPTQQEKAKLFQWNIACDLSINCHLDGKLPEFCCFPGRNKFEKYPSHLSAEEYYKLLEEDKEFQKEMEQSGEGEGGNGEGGEPGDDQSRSKYGQMDSHDNWGKDADGNPIDSSVQDVAKEAIKDAMRKAVSEAAEKQSWGSISASMRDQIIKSLQGRIDWKKVLRYFIRTSQRADKSGSIRKINKRYAYIHPGKKVNRQAEIMIAIDQSGSVSDALLAKFFGELNKLSALASFTVVPFDYTVAEDKVYKWQRGNHHKTERVSCGGTCFQAPTDFANQRSFDGMIILTDMEAPQPTRAKCQRMWITDKAHAGTDGNSYSLKPKWGEKVIVIPE